MGSSKRRKRQGGGDIKSSETGSNKNTDMTKRSLLKTILQIDERFTKVLSLCASPESSLGFLRPLMILLELICHEVIWLLGTFIVFVCVNKPEHVELVVNLFLALIFDIIINGTMKVIFRRQRPSHNQMDMFMAGTGWDSFSFPSGHTTRVAMLAVFFSERLSVDPLQMMGIISWSLCTALSRVLLGRHHVIDVALGFLIGLLEYVVHCQFWVPKELCSGLKYILFSFIVPFN